MENDNDRPIWTIWGRTDLDDRLSRIQDNYYGHILGLKRRSRGRKAQNKHLFPLVGAAMTCPPAGFVFAGCATGPSTKV